MDRCTRAFRSVCARCSARSSSSRAFAVAAAAAAAASALSARAASLRRSSPSSRSAAPSCAISHARCTSAARSSSTSLTPAGSSPEASGEAGAPALSSSPPRSARISSSALVSENTGFRASTDTERHTGSRHSGHSRFNEAARPFDTSSARATHDRQNTWPQPGSWREGRASAAKTERAAEKETPAPARAAGPYILHTAKLCEPRRARGSLRLACNAYLCSDAETAVCGTTLKNRTFFDQRHVSVPQEKSSREFSNSDSADFPNFGEILKPVSLLQQALDVPTDKKTGLSISVVGVHVSTKKSQVRT